jgi:sortase A
MTRHDRTRMLKWVERGLIALGVGCLAWAGVALLEARVYQELEKSALEQTLWTPPPDGTAVPPARLAPAGLVGQISIPRLHLTAIAVNGDDDATLGVAVGHLPDTPFPWQPGNSAFAAHRDTFFRPLKGVAPGDLIRLTTPYGSFTYRVRDTLIVKPTDVWVLDKTAHPTLTLVTCYPFSYIGHAPKRFIVRADRVTGAQTQSAGAHRTA